MECKCDLVSQSSSLSTLYLIYLTPALPHLPFRLKHMETKTPTVNPDHNFQTSLFDQCKPLLWNSKTSRHPFNGRRLQSHQTGGRKGYQKKVSRVSDISAFSIFKQNHSSQDRMKEDI